jgi:hypothetical protein
MSYFNVLKGLMDGRINRLPCGCVHHDNAPLHSAVSIRGLPIKLYIPLVVHSPFLVTSAPTDFFRLTHWKVAKRERGSKQCQRLSKVWHRNWTISQRRVPYVFQQVAGAVQSFWSLTKELLWRLLSAQMSRYVLILQRICATSTFRAEDGDSTFVQNGTYLTNYTASHPRTVSS